MSARDRIFTWICVVLGRSLLITRAAIFGRKLATVIIAGRLSPGNIDPERNGEGWLVRQMASGCRQFIDVGANVGAWSALMLASAPEARGLAYEPAPGTAAALRERFAGDERLTVVEAAVSESAGEVTFYEEADAGETASVIAGHSQTTAVAQVVESVTLDDELDRREIRHVDFLKIDAEGLDLHVLRGASRALNDGRIDLVQFEYNAPWALAGSTLAGAIELLKAADFDVYVLGNGVLRAYDYEALGEIYRYTNFVAISAAVRDRFASSVAGSVLT